MKKIPDILQEAYFRKLEPDPVAWVERRDYLKWLRFYLDHCVKYQHPPRERESLAPFLEKLASKGQSAVDREQAERSVIAYYELMAVWDPETGTWSG